MKLRGVILIILTAVFIASCTKEEVTEESSPIVGQWFLTAVNDTDVSTVNCYNESYLESDGENITFYILDRLEDGSCQQVLSESAPLTIQDDFYYLGEEALEIYIQGKSLTWRVDFETTLVFQKR